MVVKYCDVQKDQYSKGFEPHGYDGSPSELTLIPNNSSGVVILDPSLYSSLLGHKHIYSMNAFVLIPRKWYTLHSAPALLRARNYHTAPADCSYPCPYQAVSRCLICCVNQVWG